MDPGDYQQIRQLLDDYLRMYSSRDDRLTDYFSEDFSGFTGGGDFLVKDLARWVAITRQDFAQVKDPIRIELKDVAIQSLAETIAVATSFFTIHLPIPDHILSRETARLVLMFRKERAGWKICHSSISIPYHLVREGEVYPLKELVDRNQSLEKLIVERTVQLSEANASLQQTNVELACEIAEHKRVREALQRSEGLYRSILNASPDDITITDVAGGILLVSPMARRIFNCREGFEFIGRPLTDFIVPEDRPRALGQIALKRQGVATGPNEYRGLRPDGGTFDLEVNSEFIRDTEGSPTGMVVIARDITGRKQAEAERERLEAQNRQLQKAESLGRMAGAIAHHFNNQLQAVMMGLELTRREAVREGRPIEDLTTILESAHKAAEVSSLMLTYLGRVPAEHEPLDLSETCQRLLPMLRASLPSSGLMETDLPAPGPTVSANANQMQQILTNLVTNAWEAGGGRQSAIRLAVKTVAAVDIPATPRFPIDWQPQGNDYACLEVADTGCGIPGDDIEKLFDPFFSSKFAGRGLGLAVVLGIVRAHFGVITVESRPAQGSAFRVFLPLCVEAIPRQPAQAAPAPGMHDGGCVLLVEAEAVVRNVVALALKRLGFGVRVAVDGVEAVELFRQHRDEIRCVLCDLTMPRMGGWETLAALRKLDPAIPVILASAYSEAQVFERDHPDIHQAFLRKPYQLEELRDTLFRVLGNAAVSGR